MTQNENGPIVVADAPGTADNQAQPFSLEGQDVRGRAVRLGTVIDQVLGAHDYPGPVAELLGEVLVLTALLGSILKFEGSLTLQTKSSGPVGFMVADYQTPGEVRGYAQFDRAQVDAMGDTPTPRELLGDGYLAITLDQGADMERYQGIVDLEGESITECARRYFEASEQLPTTLALNAGRDTVTGNWRGGGIMIQHLPKGSEDEARAEREMQVMGEDWNRATILMESVKRDELLNPQLSLPELLFRLFHEDGVRVFEPVTLVRGCRCSEEKIRTVIESFPEEERAHMAVDGKITVTCEFCNKGHTFAA